MRRFKTSALSSVLTPILAPIIPAILATCVGTFMCACLVQTSSASSPPISINLPDLVEKVLPSVVNVSSTQIRSYQVYGMDDFLNMWGVPQERKQKQTSLGSGFINNTDGYVLTNNHVVEHASEVEITLLDKRQFRARIIGTDEKMDLALLQIRDKNSGVPPGLSSVTLGDSDATRIAESVFAVGNPFGLQHTVTVGIISAKHRTIGSGPFDNYLQTDASINPGNSGGPLFNFNGEVVGINTMIYSRVGQSGGVGFAIPANEAKRLIPDLQKYGRVPRPWLGILADRMTSQIQAYFHLDVSEGVIVSNLVEEGPADGAGVKTGDVIVNIDGTPVKEPYDIDRILSKHRPKDEISMKIQRGRRQVDIRVKMSELPRLDTLPQGII
jgi:serine protease Do